MRAAIFQVDAFANRRFTGNPAAVMPMDQFPEPSLMQAIAAENNLAETAFIVRDGSNYHIRWFTPTTEVPLCGHATLASAAVVMERLEPGRTHVIFNSMSGALPINKTTNGYIMDFPARHSTIIDPPSRLVIALGVTPFEVVVDSFNYLALLENAEVVRMLSPDLSIISTLDRSGAIITARGDGEYDFVSRYFAPAKGIPEDPVTGGAHCALAPYWALKLGKTEFHAFQASKRGGEIRCRYQDNRVELEGSCIFYLEGQVEI